MIEYRNKRATGNGQRATGNGQRATGNGQRATGNGQRATGNGQRATGNGQRATGNGQRATGNGQRATGNGQRGSRRFVTTLQQKALYLIYLIYPFKFSYCKSNLISTITFFTALLKSNLIRITLFLLSQCLLISSTNAILTATSSRFIVGNAPQVLVSSSADKHGFTVNGVFYSESSNNIKADEVKEFDGNLTLNDFKVAIYTSTNLDKVENYSDIDGDSADPQQPFKVEMTNYWWYDNNGVRIIGDDKKKPIGCGSGFSMPLKLIIKTDVKAQSEYGIPNESESVTLAKTYQIAAKPELCYAKPNDITISPNMQWRTYDATITSPISGPWEWNGKKTSRDSIHGGGYSNDYVPNWGFKIKPSGSKFPTTGFPGASFDFIMSGNKYDYTYALLQNPGGGVKVDNDGKVHLKSRPSGPVTIRIKSKWHLTFYSDYTFMPTTVWLEPKTDTNVKFNTAKNLCGGINYIPQRRDYTNSPANQVAQNTNWNVYPNSFTRAIDGSIMGEWGWVSAVNYPNSNWEKDNTYFSYYWTNEINYFNYNSYFVVNFSGYVFVVEENSNNGKIACKIF